jgi:hypothetical protein
MPKRPRKKPCGNIGQHEILAKFFLGRNLQILLPIENLAKRVLGEENEEKLRKRRYLQKVLCNKSRV